MKKYIEIGFGNTWFIRSELEDEDGTETEVKGFINPFELKSIYLRIWIGKKVLIIDSRDVIKISTKDKKKIKIIVGFFGL
ncbi:DUF3977 family protein [Paenibacillus alkalitolerans]|uniref:DUF3977 family protein n=1 Tax=Paenibacillus alkalitolerans TaxID=2799335 RepID=UPI001F203FB9|nr:DUF3977 family protein [Paenibacillus alkalitolerans]